MLWECKTKTICECSGEWALGRGTFHTGRQDWTVILADEDVERRHDHWKKTVREFTERKLSFDKDRLPTMSRLASSLAMPSFGEYLAGC